MNLFYYEIFINLSTASFSLQLNVWQIEIIEISYFENVYENRCWIDSFIRKDTPLIYVFDDVLDIKKFKLQDLKFSTPTIRNFVFHD